ncbi:MAG: leucine-rich repeat domain-containing protein [Candidatus Methanomethylophilaceae archaeon]|nr:leucine-rich repeat domain-containing protein [Candidatus Methanomethylophilaceae archaeon]
MPESVLVIGKGAFDNCGLVSVALPNQLREIHKAAFKSCRSLVSIEIPDSVTVLEEEAFESCESLKYAVISKSLEKIDRCVFCRCTKMSFVSVPKSVKRLGWEAFSCCPLESIELPGLAAWDLDAFRYCRSHLTIRVPARLKHVSPGRSTSDFNIQYI